MLDPVNDSKFRINVNQGRKHGIKSSKTLLYERVNVIVVELFAVIDDVVVGLHVTDDVVIVVIDVVMGLLVVSGADKKNSIRDFFG